VEWVLGPSRSASAPFIVTEIEPETGALLAREPVPIATVRTPADRLGHGARWVTDTPSTTPPDSP
jgi:cyclic beta-1,2-glucan synthetase